MKRGSWAVLEREIILDITGDKYLTRLRLIMTPWFSLYYHQIHEPDWDRALHSHPWVFTSFVLSGGYWEDRHVTPTDGSLFWDDNRQTLHRPRWSLRSMKRNEAHMITKVLPNTRTLVLTGKRTEGEDSWGFWERGQRTFTPWRQYLREQGHPQAEEK
jgi:hypothetical protein